MGQSNSTRRRTPTWHKSKTAVSDIKRQYKLAHHMLGSGSFGRVFEAESQFDPAIKVAIKVLNKKKMRRSQIESIGEEVAILQTLDHPNIVTYHDTFEDDNCLYLVMEQCSGENLFDSLTSSGMQFTEKQAAKLMRKMFLAVRHCHSMDIAHRDIKP